MAGRPTYIIGLVALFFVSFAGDDDFVRWHVEGTSPGPWHVVRYEITRRAPATTAVHRRRLPGTEEGDHALGLLTADESRALFDTVLALEPFTLNDDPPLPKGAAAPPAATFRCDLMLDGRAHSFVVRDPRAHPSARVRALFNLVATAVIQHAGDIPFRNTFFPLDQRGWLNIESTPAARVIVDGFETRETTPLYAYELKAGQRQVRLESLDGRLIRDYVVRVEARGTTTLRVDLR